ncbi:MAG: DoxX family protein [Candidatus Cloacimonetes bacterium]|nr:DoxX family protein [Candidatus Cloacimonadota bacterium]
MRLLEKNTDVALLIVRLSVGLLMLLHGIAKITHGISFIEGMVTNAGLPAVFAYGVYIGEIVAPLFIIAGFRTRVAALVFVGNCVVAIALAHSGDIFSLTKHGGWAIELLGLYMFGALALMFSGGGKYAVSSKHILD